MGFYRIFLSGCALAALTGCAAVSGSNDELTRRVDYLRQDVEALTAQQKALAESIDRMGARLGVAPPTPQATSDNRLPLSGSPSEPDAGPASGTPVGITEPGPALEIQNLAADPSSHYKEGLELMGSGKYDEAEKAFADFIVTYPQSDLADNAQYWIGECFYSQKNYKDAQAAFKAVGNHFPFGNKVSDALYKQSLCERQLGQADQADATLKKLAEEFPDSEAARKAAQP